MKSNRRTGLHPSSAGFTLVELIITLLIIAVLVALIAPQLGNAKRSARTSACRAQLRATGVSLSNYVEDYRRLPLSEAVASIDRQSATLEQLFMDFDVRGAVTLPTTTLCPSNPIKDNVVSSFVTPSVRFVRPFASDDLYRPTSESEGLMTPVAAAIYLGSLATRWSVTQDREAFHANRDDVAETLPSSFLQVRRGVNSFWNDGAVSSRR